VITRHTIDFLICSYM